MPSGDIETTTYQWWNTTNTAAFASEPLTVDMIQQYVRLLREEEVFRKAYVSSGSKPGYKKLVLLMEEIDSARRA